MKTMKTMKVKCNKAGTCGIKNCRHAKEHDHAIGCCVVYCPCAPRCKNGAVKRVKCVATSEVVKKC